jgi:hypothetical protein
MQYSMINYSYCTSQVTTLIYLTVYFTIILGKLLFTKQITKEMCTSSLLHFYFHPLNCHPALTPS